MNMKVDFGPKFDWFDVLDRLIAGEKPTDSDRIAISKRAGPWTTCACGQLCKILPRDSNKVPHDQELKHLGGVFAQQMAAGDYREAKKTLIKIEKRSIKLLKDMGVQFTIGGVPRTFHRVKVPVAPVSTSPVKPQLVTHNMAERFVFRGGH